MLIFDQLRKNDRQLQVLSICVLGGLSLLLLGLWYVQVLSAKRYKNTQISQSFRAVRIPAIRGKILDANGVVLAGLTPQQTALFVEQAGNFPGFDLDVQPVRVYPHHTVAAHLLGHLQRDDTVDDEEVFFNYRMPDFRGVVGVEGLLDEPLRGRTGVKSVLVNSLGYRQAENTWAPAEAGQNVFLTIDLMIQKAAEQALRSAPVPYSGPPRGAVVVMDPGTGDLIAMASNPAYDPDELVQHLSPEKAEYLNDPNLRPQINRAMQENYAPGSIFKIVVGLAGLEAGTLDPEETYHSPGYYPVRGPKPIGNPAGPGHFTFRRAF